MNLEMLKGLVPWATVKTQIGTRATSRLNPQTVSPKTSSSLPTQSAKHAT